MRMRMMMLTLVVPAFVAAGCGGGGDSSTPATTSGGAATATDGAATTTNGGATKTTKTTNGGGAQAAAGKRVFASAGCGNCHTLADAGSNGTAGPNLDDLQPDAATVANQVRSGGGGMPAFADQLSSEQIQAVAAYVASVAGK